MKRLSILIFVLLALSLIIGCASRPPAYQFRPGTYTGEGRGYGGTITVIVEVDSSRIINVTIGENRETAAFANPVFNRIPRQIVERQSLVVDTISGATLTRNGVIAGAKAALLSAGATEEQLMTPGRSR